MVIKIQEMKNYNLLSIILLATLIGGCRDSKNSFSFDETKLKEQYQPQDIVDLVLKNAENQKIDSIVYFVNDKKIGSKKSAEKMTFALKDQKMGYQNLKAIVYANGDKQEITSRVELASGIEPKLLKHTIVNMFPHDTTSFTEGFEFYRDTLYESTGQKGNSYFKKYDYKTGKVYKQVKLDNQYFGEGITMLNDKIYQLTWQSGVGFIYNANTLKKEKTFNFDKKIEGWGMTNDGTYIYQTDGTEKIWKMDPATQKMVDYINVYTQNSKIKQVNELEWVDGKIYSNIWHKNAIAVINPANGAVEAIIDLSDIVKLVKTNDSEAVLNGIAYNKKTKTFFVTGKDWDKTFEIKISE